MKPYMVLLFTRSACKYNLSFRTPPCMVLAVIKLAKNMAPCNMGR